MNNGLDRKIQLTTDTQTNFADDEFPADLLVELDRSRPRTLRAQLERGLRQAIARKTLAPGTVLPPSRVLAAELGLSRSLVVGAYEQLVIEGQVPVPIRFDVHMDVDPPQGGKVEAGHLMTPYTPGSQRPAWCHHHFAGQRLCGKHLAPAGPAVAPSAMCSRDAKSARATCCGRRALTGWPAPT